VFVKQRRSLGIIVSMAMALTMLGAATGPAAAVTRFGALLTQRLEPSNSNPAHTCAEVGQCTWVMNTAYHRPSAKAPMSGTIHHVRVIAGSAGHMKLFIGRVNATLQAKVITAGPKITFVGNGFSAGNHIETFNVNIAVSTGDSIAVRASSLSALRCDQGSPHTLQFQPALVVGGPFTTRQDDTGCWLLVEFEY
jgi:hypothetical protein